MLIGKKEIQVKVLTDKQINKIIDNQINFYGLTIDKNYRRIANAILNKDREVYNEINQKPVEKITINIEWKRSQTWGNNPNCVAEVKFKDGTYDRSPVFKASGCRYDKESTVIADIFNYYLKYKLYDKDLPTQIDKLYNPFEEREIPYGINVKIKRYDGGIGTNCYFDISKFIGGKFEKVASGSTFDVFKYTDLYN